MTKRLFTIATIAGLLFLGAPKSQAYVPYSYWQSSSWYVRLLGPSINIAGRDLNGMDLNGRVLDGRFVEAVHFAGASRNGNPANNVTLIRSRLTGIGGLYAKKAQNRPDARFVAELDDGSSVSLRIDEAGRHPDPMHRNVHMYTVVYETNQGWQPLCGLDDDSGEPVPAVALQGRWQYEQGVPGGGSHIDDADVFTFGCVNRAIGKCVLAGYKPWQQAIACSADEGCGHVSMADHHQACTRALRADYCGDGASHTADGMEINFYDSLDIRVDSLGWAVEAEWDADGARCAVAERINAETPWCMQSLSDPSCGQWAGFGNGTLLITEYDDQL